MCATRFWELASPFTELVRKMKAALTLATLALLAAAAFPPQSSHDQPFSAAGSLARDARSTDSWVVSLAVPATIRGQQINRVVLPSSAPGVSHLIAPYEGKFVQSTGDVGGTSGGTATLARLWRIGVSSSPPLAELVPHIPASTAPPPDSLAPIVRSSYHFAYFLFLADARVGCEACYVPLLVSKIPLEEIAASDESASAALITTYERDSIWQWNGAAIIWPRDVQSAMRTIRVAGRSYRYQAASSPEVLKLLENPLGSIPISRPALVNSFAIDASPSELISDFRSIFRIRERTLLPLNSSSANSGNVPAKIVPTTVASELIVFLDGAAIYRSARASSLSPNSCSLSVSWNCPSSARDATQSAFTLSSPDLVVLQSLLNDSAVRNAGSFYNAAPVSDQLDIEIGRNGEWQRITAVAFMPAHVDLQRHPALLYLVCKSKEIARRASNGVELPAWCSALPPLR